MTISSRSSKETEEIGVSLAKSLTAAGGKRSTGLVVALVGDLGAGKTTFTQGFLLGLGGKNRALSPTFVLMRRHKVGKGGFKDLYHVDAYRLKDPKEASALGLRELWRNKRNVILMEWADNLKKILPKDTVWINFKHGNKQNTREIVIG